MIKGSTHIVGKIVQQLFKENSEICVTGRIFMGLLAGSADCADENSLKECIYVNSAN